MSWEIDWIDSKARLMPNVDAIIDAKQNRAWTYQEVNLRAVALASWFKKNGVKKGNRIALLSPNHIAYFDILFACAKIGVIFVPLNWRLSNDELKYILLDSSPVLIGYHTEYKDKIEELGTDIEKTFCINDRGFDDILMQQSLLDESTEKSEEDALTMIYTGGTTGRPKGVVLSHRNILWNGINTVLSWNLTKEDVTLTSMPMFHTGGLNVLSIPLLLIGGKVVITDGFDPVQSIQYINQYQCSIVIFVPTMYHMLFQTEEFANSTFPSIKSFLSGGSPCPLDIYEVFKRKGIAFREGYGLTEAGPNNFFIDPVIADEKRGSVGKPMLFNSIKLINEEGCETEANEVGELLINGKHVFVKYWKNENATKEAIQAGWLHTGDLAKRDEQGFFYIVGRKKDMIITGGENVYPQEVEHWLVSHPDIEEVAVIGLPDVKWGEAVTAFVVMKGQQIQSRELINYCEFKLGKYKIPRKFIFVENLPKTPVGKIDKKRLKEIGLEYVKNIG